mgnify:CR=1 FL=1
MKLVCLDGYCENPGDLSWAPVADQVDEFIVYDRTEKTFEATVERIGDAEVVFTNKTPITKKIIDACPGMKFISVLATGYNVVDYQYAKEKGIPVTNVPTYGTASVGQFAIALLLEICHHIGHHNESVHAGDWERSADFCYWDYPLIELDGKTMGIIGFGRIGRKVAHFAKGLDMNELLTEIEMIVSSGTKIDITYYINEEIKEYHQEDILEYFASAESDSVELALKELGEDEYTLEEIRVMRIKYLSDVGN